MYIHILSFIILLGDITNIIIIFAAKIEIMEKWLEKRAALYQLIKIVDENNGTIIINTDKIKRIFNDEDDIVKVEYSTGDISLLSDMDFDSMNEVILKLL